MITICAGWCYQKFFLRFFLQTKPMPYQLFVIGGQEKGYKTPGAAEVLNMWRCDITGRRWHYYHSNYIIKYIILLHITITTTITLVPFSYLPCIAVFILPKTFDNYFISYMYTFTIGFNSTLTFCDLSLTAIRMWNSDIAVKDFP